MTVPNLVLSLIIVLLFTGRFENLKESSLSLGLTGVHYMDLQGKSSAMSISRGLGLEIIGFGLLLGFRSIAQLFRGLKYQCNADRSKTAWSHQVLHSCLSCLTRPHAPNTSRMTGFGLINTPPISRSAVDRAVQWSVWKPDRDVRSGQACAVISYGPRWRRCGVMLWSARQRRDHVVLRFGSLRGTSGSQWDWWRSRGQR